jgi:hypothetical protein
LVDGYTFIRQDRGPLVETMNAMWAEDDGVAAVDELFEQLRQLAEDDLGVAARASDGSVSPLAGSLLRLSWRLCSWSSSISVGVIDEKGRSGPPTSWTQCGRGTMLRYIPVGGSRATVTRHLRSTEIH